MRLPLFVGLLLAALDLSAQTWRTDAAEPAVLTGFGASVALAGSDVLIGEPLNALKPGILYVYRKGRAGNWAEVAQLRASDGSNLDRFARALAVEGNTLVVGATSRDSSRGGGYVFERGADGTWREVAQLRGTDALPGDALGRSVAISGAFAFLGAAGSREQRGAVYVFRRDGSRWAEQAKLAPAELQPNDFFGYAVAARGRLLLVGAINRNGRRGAVYPFRFDSASGTWEALPTLDPTGLESNAGFGAAIALRGDIALAGAPGRDRGTGSVYVFRYDADANHWTEETRLLPFAGTPGGRFGTSIAFDGEEAWVGAEFAENAEGRVYIFRRDRDGVWSESRLLRVDSVEAGDRFGGTVALGGTLGVAGLVGDDYEEGTAVVFEREPRSGAWRAAGRVMSAYDNFPAITGGEVRCTDGTAREFACSNVELQSFLPVQAIGGGRGVQVNDVWGWTDPETGKEYALVGRMDGTAFVDVSDPTRPRYLGELRLTPGARPAIWRDIKVYKDHAFIVADGAGPHGMQVFDLRQLRAVRNPPVTFAPTALYDRIHSAHNIVINEATGFAYTVGNSAGGETCSGGSHIINIQDPRNPTFAGCFAHPNTGRRGTGYTHDAQCVVYHGPDTEHQGKEVCFASNETALAIADVTDKANPKPLAVAAYPNVGYAHQGWLTEDHRYFFMDDEGDELAGTVPRTRTLVWDVADLDDPVLLKEHLGTQPSSDHNLYIAGRYAYQSNYVSGLRILDISDPANPVEVAYFDTVPYGDNAPGFAGSWSNYPFFRSGTILVTSMREGLFVVKHRPATLVP